MFDQLLNPPLPATRHFAVGVFYIVKDQASSLVQKISWILEFFYSKNFLTWGDLKDIKRDNNTQIWHFPPNIYFLKINNGNTRKRHKTCSKLTIKQPERRHWRRSLKFDYDILKTANISTEISRAVIKVVSQLQKASFFAVPKFLNFRRS